MTIDPIAIWSNFVASPQAPKTAMSPFELDGFLTGVLVMPQAAGIRASTWIARMWGDDEPILEGTALINAIFGGAIGHCMNLMHDIDRSLERFEADRVVDYRPMFILGDQNPGHDAVRAWLRGFRKAMALAPKAWSRLIEDERTGVVTKPFVGFLDAGDLAPHDDKVEFDNMSNAEVALIPRMILVLRKLALVRKAAAHPAPTA